MQNIQETRLIVFRIVHISNLKHIIQLGGLYTATSSPTPIPYTPIGNKKLIGQRSNYRVKIDPPNGDLGEYIPFYFGPRSPMLFNIQRGYGTTQYPAEEVIYLEAHILLLSKQPEWCFTNAHAKSALAEFFNSLADLDKIDWAAAYAKDWSENDELKYKKQAEFLVKNYVPLSCITQITVFNTKAEASVRAILDQFTIKNIDIRIEPKYYY